MNIGNSFGFGKRLFFFVLEVLEKLTAKKQ
jgi:hypothetical protein